MEALKKKIFFFITECLEKRYAEEKNRLDYYPGGSSMPGRTFNSNSYRYGFDGMEKDDEMGKGDGNSYTTEFRQYDPRLMRWLSIDPMAKSRVGLTPYNFAQNSPIVRFDPSGALDDLVITGDESGAAVAQIQSQTTMTITRDSRGKIKAEGKALTMSDRKLMEVINDHTITVKVEASSNLHIKGTLTSRAGGSFMGNKVTRKTSTMNFVLNNKPFEVGEVSWDYNSVVANQFICPKYLKAIDNLYGSPGETIMHEISESYFGATISQLRGISALPGTKSGIGKESHEDETWVMPQPGDGILSTSEVNREVIRMDNAKEEAATREKEDDRSRSMKGI